MGRLLAFLGALLSVVFGLRYAGWVPETLPDPAGTAPLALEQSTRGLRRLDLRPMWDNLPPSWQADMQLIVDRLRANHDQEMWDLGFGVLTKAAALGSLPAAAARGVDGSQRLASWLGVEPDPARVTAERWRVGAALNTIVDSPFADPTNLERLDLRQLAGILLPLVEAEFQELAGADASLLGPTIQGALDDLAAAARVAKYDEPERTSFAVEWQSTTYATAVLSEVRLVNIEDRWVMDVVAEALPARLAALKASVLDLTSGDEQGTGELLRTQLEIADRQLAAMLQHADDVAGFDAAVDGLVTELTAAVVGHRMRSMFR